jgi:hypothetical protein
LISNRYPSKVLGMITRPHRKSCMFCEAMELNDLISIRFHEQF